MPLNNNVPVQGPLRDLGGQVYNVKGVGFNARGGGVIDDAPYILDALTTANTNPHKPLQSGGELFIPTDTYKVGSPIAATGLANVAIRGTGAGSVLKPSGYAAATGKSTTCFDFSACSDIVLENLVIDGSALAAPHLGSLTAAVVAGNTTLPLRAGHSLANGDVVTIGNPEFLPATTEQRTLSGVTGTQATVAALTNGYAAGTVVATTVNGYGGHGLAVTDGARLTLRNCTFDGILRHCLWLVNVQEVLIDGCTFANPGGALVAEDSYSASNFGIGGFGVSKLKVVNSTFRDFGGRHTAAAEIRMVVNDASIADEADAIFTGNHFLRLGDPDITSGGGAGLNLVCAEGSKNWNRIVVANNTFDNISDGFVWVLNPTGHVVVSDNTMTNSRAGPYIEVTAPRCTITGNTIGGTGGHGYAGIWAKISAGTGDFATSGVDYRDVVIADNVVADMRGAVGIGIWVQGGAQVPANGPRSFIIHDNIVKRCNQDGIQIDLANGEYRIHDNEVKDTNAATLADTTLTAGVAIGATSIPVASSANFADQMFVRFAADATSYTVLDIPDATHLTLESALLAGFLSGDRAYCPFPGLGGIGLNGDANAAALHVHANVSLHHNRVGVETLGTTTWGLNLRNVTGPIREDHNLYEGCVSGDVTVTGTPLRYADNSMIAGGTAVHAAAATFVETTGAGVYTASITLPAESTIMDIKVRSTAVWTATTSALMDVGDGDDADGWFAGINLKATDLLVGEEINFVQTGGKEGVYLNTATGNRLRAYSAVAKTITGTVTTVGAAGSAGRSRLMVEYVTTTPIAAVKV